MDRSSASSDPNGAGKTTCIEALTGYLPQATGIVRFLDRDLTGLPPHRRARLGLVRTFQSVELFDDLTVRDNLRAAANRRNLWQSLRTSSRRAGTTTSRPSIEPSTSSGSPTPLTPSPPSCRKASASWPASPGPSRAGPACCSSTNRPPDSTAPRRSRSDADCATSSTTASASCSSTTTWASCSGRATGSSCSTSAQVLASGTPEEIRRNEHVLAAYLGDDVCRPRATGGRRERARTPKVSRAATARPSSCATSTSTSTTAKSSRSSAPTAPEDHDAAHHRRRPPRRRRRRSASSASASSGGPLPASPGTAPSWSPTTAACSRSSPSARTSPSPRRARQAAATRSRSSPSCKLASAPRRDCSPAASSRCSPSPGHSSDHRSFSSSTSSASGSRR